MSIYDFTDEFMVAVQLVENIDKVIEKCKLSEYLNTNFEDFIQNSHSKLTSMITSDNFQMFGIEVEFKDNGFLFKPLVEFKLNNLPEKLVVDTILSSEQVYSIGGIVRLIRGDMSLGIELVSSEQIVRARLLTH